MTRKSYSKEDKVLLIKEFQRREITAHNFAMEKLIKRSTFYSWLREFKNNPLLLESNAFKTKQQVTPFDVTEEMKEIVKDELNRLSNTFTLETKGMKLTFSIKNFKEVFEVINHD